jgi:histidinol phosphatase-like PHP family hydrolase
MPDRRGPLADRQLADLHTHTTFSDGRLSPEEVVAIAWGKGLRVGIADHCGPGRYQLGSDDRFDRYRQRVAKVPAWCAVELDLGRPVAVSAGRLARCHYLIGGVHGVDGVDFFDPNVTAVDHRWVIDRMLAAVEAAAKKYRFQILAHPGLLPLCLRPRTAELLDDGWNARLIELTLRYGFAWELSSRWQLPLPSSAAAALGAGVMFSLGSDAHHAAQVGRLDYALGLLESVGIGPGRLYQPASDSSEDSID